MFRILSGLIPSAHLSQCPDASLAELVFDSFAVLGYNLANFQANTFTDCEPEE